MIGLDEAPLGEFPPAALTRLWNWCGEDTSLFDQRERKPAEHWDKIAAGVGDGVRNESAASYIGMMLSEWRNLDNVRPLWVTVEAWNRSNRPPMDLRELETTFKSILSRERKRRAEDALDSPAAIVGEPSGSATDGKSGLEGWRLVDRDTTPSSYWVFGPEWDGHVEVDHATLCDATKLWRKITDVKKVVPDKKRFVKRWNGRYFKYLLEHREVIPAPREQDRVAVVAGVLHEILHAALQDAKRETAAEFEVDPRGLPQVLPDCGAYAKYKGDVVFKFNEVLARLAMKTAFIDKVNRKKCPICLSGSARIASGGAAKNSDGAGSRKPRSRSLTRSPAPPRWQVERTWRIAPPGKAMGGNELGAMVARGALYRQSPRR